MKSKFKQKTSKIPNQYTECNAALKQLLQKNNIKLVQSYYFGNHKPNTNSKTFSIEFHFNVNNIPYRLARNKSGFTVLHMNLSEGNLYRPDHFGVIYEPNNNTYDMWESVGTDCSTEYQDILLKELQEEELFQYSLLYKNIHKHKILVQACTELSQYKNCTVIQIVNKLQKVIQCLKQSENL